MTDAMVLASLYTGNTTLKVGISDVGVASDMQVRVVAARLHSANRRINGDVAVRWRLWLLSEERHGAGAEPALLVCERAVEVAQDLEHLLPSIGTHERFGRHQTTQPLHGEVRARAPVGI